MAAKAKAAAHRGRRPKAKLTRVEVTGYIYLDGAARYPGEVMEVSEHSLAVLLGCKAGHKLTS